MQFFFFKNRDGEPELVTAPLTDGTILPGITRDSILTLCREWGEFKVSERKITLHEVMEAVEEDRVRLDDLTAISVRIQRRHADDRGVRIWDGCYCQPCQERSFPGEGNMRVPGTRLNV